MHGAVWCSLAPQCENCRAWSGEDPVSKLALGCAKRDFAGTAEVCVLHLAAALESSEVSCDSLMFLGLSLSKESLALLR